MKKIVYTFLCILIGMSIGIPLIYNDDNRLSAAVDDGEKIIDFEFSSLVRTNSSLSISWPLYAISERQNVYFVDAYVGVGASASAPIENTISLVMEESGKPLELVKKNISGRRFG